MSLSIEVSTGLNERKGNACDFARQDHDRLGRLQPALSQLRVYGFEHLTVGRSHARVVEQATQQGRFVFGQAASATMNLGTVWERIQACVGDERAGTREAQET